MEPPLIVRSNNRAGRVDCARSNAQNQNAGELRTILVSGTSFTRHLNRPVHTQRTNGSSIVMGGLLRNKNDTLKR